MQNTSIDIEFLLSEIVNIKPKLKNLSTLEQHIGKKVIDLIMFILSVKKARKNL